MKSITGILSNGPRLQHPSPVLPASLGKEIIMLRLLIGCILSFYVISASAADLSCATQAAEKKLAGAAKTSFMNKCERDARTSCESAAGEKKLAGAAKTSFTNKCMKDA